MSAQAPTPEAGNPTAKPVPASTPRPVLAHDEDDDEDGVGAAFVAVICVLIAGCAAYGSYHVYAGRQSPKEEEDDGGPFLSPPASPDKAAVEMSGKI